MTRCARCEKNFEADRPTRLICPPCDEIGSRETEVNMRCDRCGGTINAHSLLCMNTDCPSYNRNTSAMVSQETPRTVPPIELNDVTLHVRNPDGDIGITKIRIFHEVLIQPNLLWQAFVMAMSIGFQMTRAMQLEATFTGKMCGKQIGSTMCISRHEFFRYMPERPNVKERFENLFRKFCELTNPDFDAEREIFKKCVEWAQEDRAFDRFSVSGIQRKFNVGWSPAKRVLDKLEKAGFPVKP